MLKWGTYAESVEGAERLRRMFDKVVSNKALYALLLLAAFVLLSGATDKWAG